MTKKSEQTQAFSIRLTESERRELRKAVGKRPLGVFIRGTLLGPPEHRPISGASQPSKAPKTDDAIAARLLAKLGQSGLASSLRTLSQAARMGALPVTEETDAALHKACSDIAAMKQMLMKALPVKERRS